MAITVRELLRLPHLQLSLTAGEAGLDREISWVHTSDLPEPWEWLGSGELLLTNGTGLSPDEPVQVAFIERLAETGASGLGLGLGMSGPPLAGQVTRRAELHIHKQTLGYRIRKIEQLTGRGLARTEDLAEWWFALRAHDLLTGGQLS